MSDIWEAINQLKEELKLIAKDSRDLIYERKNILDPLTPSEMKRLSELDEKHAYIYKRIKQFENAIKKEKRDKQIKDNFANNPELTNQEYLFLKLISSESGLMNKDIRVRLSLNKSQSYSHARTFLVAGLICTRLLKGATKYFITAKGTQFLEHYSKMKEEENL